MSADGYVTTPNGWPPQVVDPAHGHGSHGVADFLRTCEAALMGRTTNRGGDVHLIGGPQTIETFRALGALDKLVLVVLPFVLGGGMRLTDAVSIDLGLEWRAPAHSTAVRWRSSTGYARTAASSRRSRKAGPRPRNTSPTSDGVSTV
jgi:dihydrofolate reductase